MNIKVKQYIHELDDALELVKSQTDDEDKSMLTNIMCIRISGLLEMALKCRISDYSAQKTPQEINRFLTQKFKDITNLKSTKLSDVLGQFSTIWQNEFDEELEQNSQLKSSLDSLINIRNNLAHCQKANTSLRDTEQYYKKAL